MKEKEIESIKRPLIIAGAIVFVGWFLGNDIIVYAGVLIGIGTGVLEIGERYGFLKKPKEENKR